jgi:mgtE-like transporter
MATLPHRRFIARVRGVIDSDAHALRQALAATLVSSGGDLVAGLTLASLSDTLEHKLPGLIVLIPAAIGMRGNIFGALGSRFGTSIHTGTFSLTRRRDTVVGQNVMASIALTFAVSGALAVLAKVVGSAFGQETISIADYLVISVIGGLVSSIFVLGLTIAVAASSVRRGWDMDNVAAPLVTAAGDMVTLPALFIATFLVDIQGVTVTLAVVSGAVAVIALVMGLRAKLPILRAVVRESLPILVIAGTIDLVAGVTIQNSLASFTTFPALLVLVPPFLEDTGATGSVLSSRLASKLHLGIIEPRARPQRAARDDFVIIGLLAIPVFLLVAVSSQVAAVVTGQASPGLLPMMGVSLIGGAMATAMALLVGYYGAVATYRLGLDPDNFGIPLLTSSMDLIGALSLILAIGIMRIS